MTRGRDVSVAEVHEHIQRTLEHEANHRSDHDATLWCFRYVLEGWTYEEAEERFRTEAIRNCSPLRCWLEVAQVPRGPIS